jgi:hypothetical protein
MLSDIMSSRPGTGVEIYDAKKDYLVSQSKIRVYFLGRRRRGGGTEGMLCSCEALMYNTSVA